MTVSGLPRRFQWMLDGGAPLDLTWFGGRADGLANSARANDDAIAWMLAVAKDGGYEMLIPRGRGVYNYSTTIALDWSHASLRGDHGTELKFTGAGKVLTSDAGAVSGALYGIRVRNLILVGNATATVGVYLRGVLNAVVDSVRVEDVSEDALRQEFGSLNVISNFICSRNVRNFTVLPTRGIYLGQRGTTHSTSTRIVNPTIEGLYVSGQTGIYIDYADKCQVVGGTSEGNDIGLQITGNGGQHRIESLWMEANTTADIICAGWWNTFDHCLSDSLCRFTLAATCYGNTLRDGSYVQVTNLSTYQQKYDGCALTTLTDTVTAVGNERRYWLRGAGNWSGA